MSESESKVMAGHVPTSMHGRYLVRRAAGRARGTLIGFHGYGEDAEAMMAELEQIPDSDRWDLVALNSLHQFYKRSGEVVGSWMTSRDRELMIADNRAYVVRVVDQVVRARPLIAIGFSQGVAMAYRTAAISELDVVGVVALAGDLPPELAETDLRGFPSVLIARGEAEEWYTGERAATDIERLRRDAVSVEQLEFDGAHEWTQEVRNRIGDFVEGL